jgi:hypothetical protein
MLPTPSLATMQPIGELLYLKIPTIKWYHQVSGHPGSKRLYEQLKQRYYHRDLGRLADNLNCDFCQRNKLNGKGYGFLTERKVQSILSEECAVGLIGPWIVQVREPPQTLLMPKNM